MDEEQRLEELIHHIKLQREEFQLALEHLNLLETPTSTVIEYQEPLNNLSYETDRQYEERVPLNRLSHDYLYGLDSTEPNTNEKCL